MTPQGRAGHRPRPEYDQGCAGSFPDKVAGRHRWVFGVMYVLTEAQASAVHHGARVLLDHENRADMTMGCWDCRRDYADCMADPCAAAAVPLTEG
jgi:hypothetical protein